MPLVVASFIALFDLSTENVSALAVQNSASEITGGVQTMDDKTGYQTQVARPQQAIDDAILQADQIERSMLTQYKNDNDLIVGTYSYGLFQDLRLTKQQAEIIKNGYIPILGNKGDPAAVNSNPKTGVEYAEIDGGSGGRSITACYDPNVRRKAGQNDVLVKGSMYGMSNGGYVCVDPYNIRYEACSIISEMNPCINGTYKLDNNWLLSIGVNTAEIRRQIEANKQIGSTPMPPQPTPEPEPTPATTEPIQ